MTRPLEDLDVLVPGQMQAGLVYLVEATGQRFWYNDEHGIGALLSDDGGYAYQSTPITEPIRVGETGTGVLSLSASGVTEHRVHRISASEATLDLGNGAQSWHMAPPDLLDGLWRIDTETHSVHLLRVEHGAVSYTRTTIGQEDALRRDGETMPARLCEPLALGLPAVLELNLRRDGAPTTRTTTPVSRIHRYPLPTGADVNFPASLPEM